MFKQAGCKKLNSLHINILYINIILITGQDRPVSTKDRVNMPYTDAVLYECLRKGNIAQVGLPHIADKDLIVDEMVIIQAFVYFWCQILKEQKSTF